MGDKEKMSKEMLDAFNIFCQKFTTPETVDKHLASTVATVPEVEKAGCHQVKTLHSKLIFKTLLLYSQNFTKLWSLPILMISSQRYPRPPIYQ